MNRFRNKVFCEKKGRFRLAFNTREKADYFIGNYEEMVEGEIEMRPIRSFYCPSCDRWHITHIPREPNLKWVDERDDKINELQVLVQRLKSEFRQKDWRLWQTSVGEGINMLSYFKERPGFEKFVESLEGTLEHAAAIIKNSDAKENGSADEDFKRMRKELERKAKSLDYEGLVSDGKEMVAHFNQDNLYKVLIPANFKWFCSFEKCMGNEITMDVLRSVMERADDSIADASTVPSEEICEQVLSLTLWMDELFISNLPRTLWDALQAKVKKIANVLEFCYSGQRTPEGFSLMEKVRIVSVEKMFDGAMEASDWEEDELAEEILQRADSRIGSMPLSKKKMELMKRLCEIGEKVL